MLETHVDYKMQIITAERIWFTLPKKSPKNIPAYINCLHSCLHSCLQYIPADINLMRKKYYDNRDKLHFYSDYRLNKNRCVLLIAQNQSFDI